MTLGRKQASCYPATIGPMTVSCIYSDEILSLSFPLPAAASTPIFDCPQPTLLSIPLISQNINILALNLGLLED